MSTLDPEENDEFAKRQVLAITLIVICYLVFTQFFAPGAPPAADPSVSPAPAASVDPTPGVGAPAPGVGIVQPAPDVMVPEREIAAHWQGVQARFSTKTGAPVFLEAQGYKAHNPCDWLPSWLISGFSSGFQWRPFTLACKDSGVADLVGDKALSLLPIGVDGNGIGGDTSPWRLTQEAPGSLAFVATRGAFEVTRHYAWKSDAVVVDYRVEVRNVSAAPAELKAQIGVADYAEVPEDTYAPARLAEAYVDGDIEQHGPDALRSNAEVEEGPVSWLGVGDRYFLIGIEPTAKVEGRVEFLRAPGDERYGAVLALPAQTLAPGEVKGWDFRLYAGPKNKAILEGANLGMAEAVDFGFFGLVAIPLLAGLKYFHGITASWGLSIILLTVGVKLILFPLNQKSFRSMKAMQKLQPELKLLQEKYKDDREALNREMMALWNKHGVNPMGGCLPMVAQMPIWFAMYQVLYASVDLYQTQFLYFCDLSQRDPIGIFPLALGISMYIQQKMTPTAGADPMQVKMMQYMTLFFAVIMFTMPAGLSVYMLVNNVLSIAQQQFIQRTHDEGGAPIRTGRKA